MGGVLVTGAGGFIGSHVARRLLADGEEVHVLLRQDSPAKRLEVLDGLRRWTGDLDDVAEKEHQGLFRVPRIQEGLQARVKRPRPVTTA